jgi:hypothetical protein
MELAAVAVQAVMLVLAAQERLLQLVVMARLEQAVLAGAGATVRLLVMPQATMAAALAVVLVFLAKGLMALGAPVTLQPAVLVVVVVRRGITDKLGNGMLASPLTLQAEPTAAVAAVDAKMVTPAVMARFVSSTPARPVASHQQTPAIFN